MTSLVEVGLSLIDKILPDKSAQEQAKLKLLELQQSGSLAELKASTDLALAQSETNKAEAASRSLFVAGWRPAIGWTCAAALAYQFVLKPIGTAAYVAYTGHAPAFTIPGIDNNLWELLTGMLGLGALRTFEKSKGVA